MILSRRSMSPVLAFLVTVLLVTSCGDAPVEESPAADPGVNTDPPPALSGGDLAGLSADRIRLALPWGSGNIRNRGLDTDTVRSLIDLRLSAGDGFDRLTAEMDGMGSLVGYFVLPGAGPVETCGGNAVRSATGESWLNVRFVRLRVSENLVERIVGAEDAGGIREIRVACHEDETLELAILRSRPGRHRVIEVRDPSGVVIDLEY